MKLTNATSTGTVTAYDGHKHPLRDDKKPITDTVIELGCTVHALW